MDIRYACMDDNEHCGDCGRPYAIVWQAETALWHSIMGNDAGLLCPDCFDIRAARANIHIMWHVVEI